jgi:hypothetical protein
MFRLYVCSHRQTGYRTLKQKTIKINTIQLWGRDPVCTSMYSYTNIYKVHKNIWTLQKDYTKPSLSFHVLWYLTFIGPCIVVYFYSKTNQIHYISNLFYFVVALYMFRAVFSSIIRILRLYIQHQVYIKHILLTASGNEKELSSISLASSQQNLSDIHLMLYVQS